MNDHPSYLARILVDLTAVAGIGAALLQYAPPAAAVIASLYYAFLVWEHPIGRKWRKGWGLLFRRLVRQNLGPHDPEELMVYWFLGLAGVGFLMAMLAVQFGVQTILQ